MAPERCHSLKHPLWCLTEQFRKFLLRALINWDLSACSFWAFKYELQKWPSTSFSTHSFNSSDGLKSFVLRFRELRRSIIRWQTREIVRGQFSFPMTWWLTFFFFYFTFEIFLLVTSAPKKPFRKFCPKLTRSGGLVEWQGQGLTPFFCTGSFSPSQSALDMTERTSCLLDRTSCLNNDRTKADIPNRRQHTGYFVYMSAESVKPCYVFVGGTYVQSETTRAHTNFEFPFDSHFRCFPMQFAGWLHLITSFACPMVALVTVVLSVQCFSGIYSVFITS